MDEPNPPSSISTSEPAPPTAPPPVPAIHSVFIGPQGLRPIWRLILYLAMAALTGALLNWLVSSLQNARGTAGLWVELLNSVILAVSVITPAFVMARIERRRWDDYGLPRQQAFGKFFWIGALWGLASITSLLLVMHGAGTFDFGGLALHGKRVFKFAVYWAVFFVMVGFFEEFLFRGYTLFTGANGVGFWPAAVLLSACFGAVHWHNPGENWIGLLAAAFIGLFLCLTVRRTGSLWFAVGFHASWDWGESFLYSVPDSGGMVTGHLLKSSFHGPAWLTGGSVGPEGSVLVFATVAVMWAAFDRIYPQAKYLAK